MTEPVPGGEPGREFRADGPPLELLVFEHGDDGRPDRRPSAEWCGDPGWLSIPREGDSFRHCDQWTDCPVVGVVFNLPPERHAAVSVHVTASPATARHLIERHGFQDLAAARAALDGGGPRG